MDGPSQKCPKCGSPALELIDIDYGTRNLLKGPGETDEVPGQVCSKCYATLTNQTSHGAKLRLEQQAKENNRHMIWKSRVNLVRHARQMMTQKAYSEAAVSYEKYLRVLEISYELKPGALTPEVFGNSSRSKELTIVTTTYWDLLRIYDTNPQYRARMTTAAKKLAEFLPHSPIYAHVVKGARDFLKTAKNPDLIQDFLKKCQVHAGRCFIATAAFDSADHPTVVELRKFRDEVLLHSSWGAIFVRWYYRFSPPVAEFIRRHPQIGPVIRLPLKAFIYIRTFLRTPLVRPHRKE